MALSAQQQKETVVEVTSCPGHEKVRALVNELLVHGLGARSSDVGFEHYIAELRGVVDGLQRGDDS